MKQYTTEELSKETCRSFGGNNCVLHQCMFDCVLNEAKKRAAKNGENEVSAQTTGDRTNLNKNTQS